MNGPTVITMLCYVSKSLQGDPSAINKPCSPCVGVASVIL